MGDVDARLDAIAQQIAAVARPRIEPEAGIGRAICSSLELGEVLLRTLAAAEAVRAAEGSSISVRRSDGTFASAVRGLAQPGFGSEVVGSPTCAPFVSPLGSRDIACAGTVRIGLTVPLGADNSGSLTVYSRHPRAFDAEAANLLAAIARQATPSIQAALSILDPREPVPGGSRDRAPGRVPVVAPGSRAGDPPSPVEQRATENVGGRDA